MIGAGSSATVNPAGVYAPYSRWASDICGKHQKLPANEPNYPLDAPGDTLALIETPLIVVQIRMPEDLRITILVTKITRYIPRVGQKVQSIPKR